MRLFCILLSGASVLAAASGWVKLFNGKNLDGWEIHSGTARYEVLDGAIVGTAVLGSPNTFVCTTQEYGDFELELQVKVDPSLNSGIQIRSQIAKEPMVFNFEREGKAQERKIPVDRVYGYQVEISTAAQGTSGNIYDEARRARFLDDFTNKPRARAAFKDNEWNKYRIVAKGDRLQTWVNGAAAADIQDSMTARGVVCLQVHSVPKDRFQPYQVRWRDIRIRELR